ncbi:MAG TPA: protein kinase [Thermoanaerobaculia bacterium]
MTLATGMRLGPYEVLGPLGAGGMGEVYRARDERLARNVALKVLPAEISADAARLERFEKEARAASSLNHPSIVTIYDIGSSGSVSYIAMELVDGRTLRDLLVSGSIALRRLLTLSAQIADGLAKAHAAGIVHRDLKPENLMVTRDGFVKILDFGLAKLVPSAFESSDATDLKTVTRATEPGTVLGTVGYMSPEQASGHPVDFRSDQFSLGAILYEMVAGKRAFDRPTAVQTLSAVIQDDPEPLSAAAPKVPTNLAWIIERCLAKDPEERYASTRDLARDLAALRDHASGISVSGVAPPAARRFRPSRFLLGASGLAAAVLSVLAFLTGQMLQAHRDREAPPPLTRTLTFRRGFLTGARFAPDGQTIVYSAAWDGKPSEIFTSRVGSADARPLGIFPAGILSISSTGEMAISLGCENRWEPCFGTLARVPLAGGTPREVLEAVASADFSPDGKDLAAIHAVEGGDRIEYPIGKVLYQTGGYLTGLRVSPDGNRISFNEHPQGDDQRGIVCVVDRSGHKTNLTDEWRQLGSSLWSPTGQEVFFRGNRKGEGWGSWGVTLSRRLRAATWLPGLQDVSEDGMILDLGGYQNMRRDILALVPGAAKETNLSWLGESDAVDLSRDGRVLLFYDYNQAVPESFETFLRKTDGSDATLLGEGKALALSPDGKWALVVRPHPAPHLALLPTGVGEVRELPSGGAAFQYHWATFFPDGRRILIAAQERGKTPRSYVQDLSGGSPVPFAEEGMRATLVSPDGREIAGSTLEGLHLIYRADGEGRARAILGAEPGDFLVAWSADGKSILVRGAEERPLTLYRIDLASGRRERWKELAPPDMAGFLEFGAGPMGVRVTPDFRYYAYTFYTDLDNLKMTELGKSWWK